VRSKKLGFEQLEKEVGLEYFRPVYRWSNQSIHAPPGGLIKSLGDPFRKVPTLSSASNAGLADPGQLTAVHLVYATEALLYPPDSIPANRVGWDPDIEALKPWQAEFLDIMEAIANKAQDAFMEAEDILRDEEEGKRSK
jgi:hypothetical protein